MVCTSKRELSTHHVTVLALDPSPYVACTHFLYFSKLGVEAEDDKTSFSGHFAMENMMRENLCSRSGASSMCAQSGLLF